MALEQQPVALTGGLNMLLDPLAVADTELIYSKNLFPRKPGIASVRWAMRHLEYITPNPNVSSYNFNEVRDFWFTNNLAAGIVLAVAGGNDQGQGTHYGNAYDYPDEGVRLLLVDSIDLAGSIAMQTLGDIEDRPCVFDLNDYIIAVDGLNEGFYWQRGTPFVWSPITWTGEVVSGFKPKLAVPTFGANRTVYAQDNFLVWSDSRQPFVVGGSIPSPESSPITAIDKVSASGVSQAQTDLLLVRNLYSAYLVSGAPDETSATDGAVPSWAKLPVAAGCVSQATSVNTPYGQIWCGPDDVWILSGGSIPQRIGSKIRPAIQRLAPGYEWTAHAAYADGIYRLCLPSAGQEQGPGEPLQEQYWLDLRNGLGEGGGQWYGPQVPIPQGVWDGADRQGTTCIKLDTRVGNTPLACSAVALRSLPAVDESFNTYPTAIALVAFDGDEPVDSAYPRYAAHPEQRLPSTAYEVDDIVSWNDFLWKCVTAGTTDVTTTSSVFTGPGTGGSWANTGTFAGANITDGGVVWQSVMVVPDGVDGSFFPKRSACPAFTSNARANDSLVRFEILTKEYVGKDPQLDKRIDGADLSYVTGVPFVMAYQFLPNITGYDYPGIEKTLAVADNLTMADTQYLPVVADVRRMVKDHLPADPTKRNAAQHFQARFSNLGDWPPDGYINTFFIDVWAKVGASYYRHSEQFAFGPSNNQPRETLAQVMTKVQTGISILLSTLTVTELTTGAIVLGDLVFDAFTFAPINAENPQFDLTIELTPFSPLENVWLLFNDYGPTNPDGSAALGPTSDPVNRAMASGMFGGSIPLSAYGDGLTPVEALQQIRSPSSVWSCRPTAVELPTLSIFTKTYGRRDKTGAPRQFTTT